MKKISPPSINNSFLSRGNEALRQKKYEEAIALFNSAKSESFDLNEQIDFNISYTQRLMIDLGIKRQTTEYKPTAKKNLALNLSYEYQVRIETIDQNSIVGWVVNKEVPADIFEIEILINEISFIKVRNSNERPDLIKHKKSAGKGGFNAIFPKGLFDEGLNSVSIKFPNGKKEPAGVVSISQPIVVSDVIYAPYPNRVSVIVPIYNAIDDVRVCIERLRLYTKAETRIFLINDASSDPSIKTLLAEPEVQKNFIVVHNSKNLGFTKTVNKGINLAEQDDVILLNSDARVTPRWIEGMQRALATDSRIATVTAMSDRAGAFSAPQIGNVNELPLGVSETDYAIAFRRRSRTLYPSVPTGNGFCMYIKRTTINEIGALDEAAFPRGYGEENDFCMRARAQGWRNIVDDATYIFHDRSKSFAGEKDELIKAGRQIVDKRYPDYKKAISVFSESPLFALARFSAKQALTDCLSTEGVKPRALFVVATNTGGTPQTNRDLMLALYESWEPWLLHSDSKTVSLYRIHSHKDDELVLRHHLSEPVDPLTHISFEYDRVLSNWLGKFDFDIVHIRHLAWHSLSLPKLAKLSGSRVINSFHDYYAICPTVKLLDSDGEYCGGNCIHSKAVGACSNPLWKDEIPVLKNSWVNAWRTKFQDALSEVDEFITTSQHAKKTLIDNLPRIDATRFHVINHGRDFTNFITPKVKKLNPEAKLKILIPGNIDKAKGGDFLLEILDHDKLEKIEFHILGTTDKALKKSIQERGENRIIFHGPYKREDFTKHVQSISPDFGAIFSIWDETWCHTLTELWASGLPAIVLDFPTVADRVQKSQAGWVLSRGDAAQAFKTITGKVVEEYAQKLKFVKKWQDTEGLFRNTRWMAAQYHAIYKRVRTREDALANSPNLTNRNVIAVVCPSNQSQTAAPGSTHIRIWENSRNNLKDKLTFCKMTPEQLIAGVTLAEINRAVIQRNILTDKHLKALIPFIKKDYFSYCLDLDDNLLSVPHTIDTDNVYAKYSKTLKRVISHASSVTVSTQPLAQELSKLSDKVSFVPNKISARLWRGHVCKRTERDFTAIYFGTKSHKEDFELVLPALQKVSDIYPEFKLIVIGALDAEYLVPDWVKILSVPSANRNYPEFVSWLKEITKEADIGIAPLKETSFNRFKSNLKALECAALALPVIASRGGVYDNLSDEAPSIQVIENTTEAWSGCIIRSIQNRDNLLKLGEENRNWVMQNHASDCNNRNFYEWLSPSYKPSSE